MSSVFLSAKDPGLSAEDFRPSTDWLAPQSSAETALLGRLAALRKQPLTAKAPLHSAPRALSTTLAPAARALTRREVYHLLRRTQFSAAPEEVDTLVGTDSSTVVAGLVADAVAQEALVPPEWIDEAPPRRRDDEEAFREFVDRNNDWMTELRYDVWEWLRVGGLRERMTLFWHNHFVTESRVVAVASFAYRYMALLREHALGNLKPFVHAIGTDPAMLIYLNGTQNQAGAPNENYARELLELFTMGPIGPDGSANYTDVGDVSQGESDVEQVARALTGWIVDYYTLSSNFLPFRYDDGDKTIFDHTGAFGYDEVIELIFAERSAQIAHFISTKLYRAFVYEVPNEAVVQEMADLMLANDFEIAPVLEALLASEHFYDPDIIGAKIKSPVDTLLMLTREAAHTPPPESRRLYALGGFQAGQIPLDPPNVAGWPGHHAWLDTSTMPVRWYLTEFLMLGGRLIAPFNLIPIAEALHDPLEEGAVFHLAEALASHVLAIPLDEVQIDAPDEPFSGNLVDNPIPPEILDGPEHVLKLTQVLLAGIPWYEWDLTNAEAANTLLLLYLRYLTQLPEYQLT